MEVDPEVLLKIERFKNDLYIMNTHSLYNKYITWGDCYVMSDESHNYLREQIAEHFRIDPNYVVVVGSAKLGFSIARGKRYRQFIKVTDIGNDSGYDHPSDIDVAIISPDLFDAIWMEVFDYWSDGGSVDYLTWPNRDRKDFMKYLFRGWIRPDKLPTSSTLNLYKNWWEFFEQLPSTGSFGSSKIAGGIYKS